VPLRKSKPFVLALIATTLVPAADAAAASKLSTTLKSLTGTTKASATSTVKSTASAVTTTATSTTAAAAVPATTIVPGVTSATTTAAANAVSAPAVSEMTTTCTESTSFKAFSAFGDNADYSFAPGGSFEGGAAGWSLDDATVVDGNETLGIFGGTKRLFIKDRGRVVSPWFCVTPEHPTFRYVTYGGEIEMEIDYKVVGESDIDDKLVGETNGGAKWAPSAVHALAAKIPDYKLSKGVLARIVFEAEDDVYVDDVLVDPYRRG
jgi:hypothetical protein